MLHLCLILVYLELGFFGAGGRRQDACPQYKGQSIGYWVGMSCCWASYSSGKRNKRSAFVPCPSYNLTSLTILSINAVLLSMQSYSAFHILSSITQHISLVTFYQLCHARKSITDLNLVLSELHSFLPTCVLCKYNYCYSLVDLCPAVFFLYQLYCLKITHSFRYGAILNNSVKSG